MSMSIQDLQPYASENKTFMTRLAFAYEYKIPYSIVSDRIRRGEIALHFVNNKVQINVEEALKACERKRPKKVETKNDLFA
jgi:hypothetical protein